MVKMMVVKGTMMRILVKVMGYVFMMVVIKEEIKEGSPLVGFGVLMVRLGFLAVVYLIQRCSVPFQGPPINHNRIGPFQGSPRKEKMI